MSKRNRQPHPAPVAGVAPAAAPAAKSAPINVAIINLRKDSAQREGAVTTGPGGTYAWPYQYDVLARLPELHPWHARCLEVKAAATLGVGYEFDTKEEQATAAARATLEDLVPESFAAFCAFAEFQLDATGLCYIEVVRNGGGQIAELHHMPTQYTWLKKDGGYLYQADGTTAQPFVKFGDGARTAELHEVIMLCTPFLRDRHYGLPRWLAAIRAINLDNEVIDWNTNFFTNGAIPQLAIVVEGGEFTPEAETKVQEFLQTNFKGTANAHRTLLLYTNDPNVKARFEKLGFEVREASFSRLRQDNRDEVISAHGVPPRMLGIMSAAQLGGSNEVAGQMLVFEQLTLAPVREKFEKTLNKTLIPDLGLPPIRFRKVDVSSWTDDATALASLKEKGIITVAEAREDLGYSVEVPAELTVRASDADALGKALRTFEKALDDDE